MQYHIQLYDLLPWQENVLDSGSKFKVLNCGRRSGKSTFLVDSACDGVLSGERVAFYNYSYKTSKEAWNECVKILQPIIKKKDEAARQLETTTGGVLHFWSSRDPRSGRGHKYHRVLCDEVAFWLNANIIIYETILPTLADYNGDLVLASTPYGTSGFWYETCTTPPDGFEVFHQTIYDNPYISEQGIKILKTVTDDLTWAQEYMAEFVDINAEPFFWNYDSTVHYGTTEFDFIPDVETWVSLDFNYDPCVATVYQIRSNAVIGMRQYKIKGGTRALCQYIKTQDVMEVDPKYWMVTGDSTGMAKSAVAGNVSNWDIVKEEFGLRSSQLVNVQKRNAAHQYSRVVCNEFLYVVPFRFDARMGDLNNEMAKARPKSDGNLYKNRDDGHAMDGVDTFRYFVTGKFRNGVEDMRILADVFKKNNIRPRKISITEL